MTAAVQDDYDDDGDDDDDDCDDDWEDDGFNLYRTTIPSEQRVHMPARIFVKSSNSLG